MLKNMEALTNIDEMNITIADFMGYYHQASKFYPKSGERGKWFKDAKYHSSWDWLMPVGKKIYDLLADMMKQRPQHTACHGDVLEVDIHCYIREYNLPKAHQAVYQFIQWYNKQSIK
jgi:hypothetical protein